MTSSIENYAMIGDLGTAALVGRDGSIDWLCWPCFDSDACFSALLGTPEHGRWLMAPKCGRENNPALQAEHVDFAIRFEIAEGAVTLIDFMPPREGTSHIIRLLVGERGCVACHSGLVLRFGYGANLPWVTHFDETTLRAIAGPNLVVLRSRCPCAVRTSRPLANSKLRRGRPCRPCCRTRRRTSCPKQWTCRHTCARREVLDRLVGKEQDFQPME